MRSRSLCVPIIELIPIQFECATYRKSESIRLFFAVCPFGQIVRQIDLVVLYLSFNICVSESNSVYERRADVYYKQPLNNTPGPSYCNAHGQPFRDLAIANACTKIEPC